MKRPRWKKRTDCIAQAQVSAEVKGHIMKSRHKTDGHIWAEMGFIIKNKGDMSWPMREVGTQQ